MPRRALPLPRSDVAHLDALTAAQHKIDSLQPGEIHPLSAKTSGRLARVRTVFGRAYSDWRAVLGQQTEATTAANREKEALRIDVAHFFQALNLAIARGEPGFRAGDRTYYGLAANQGTLPTMVKETELLRVAETLVSGEAKRVAAGGKRCTMPTAKEISRRLREVKRLVRLRKRLVAECDRKNVAVARLRPEVADLVRDIWDELDFAWRRDEPAARRRRLREWGVVFVTRGREAKVPGITSARLQLAEPQSQILTSDFRPPALFRECGHNPLQASRPRARRRSPRTDDRNERLASCNPSDFARKIE